MAKVSTIQLKDDSIRQTFSSFLTDLFTKNIIEGCLVPLELPNRANVVQTLVTDPKNLVKADPFAPVMPVNTARLLQKMTKLGPSAHKMALVMRPCELRALIELMKLKQADLENMLVISFDCYGAYPINDYQAFAAEKESSGDEFLKSAFNEEYEKELRWTCQVCKYPSPFTSDLTINFAGNPNRSQALQITAATEKGEQALEALELELNDVDASQEKVATDWIAQRTKDRDTIMEEARKAAAGPEKMLEFLSTCIRCHNCMTNCPVCYCKECFFVSSTFELDAEKYFDWAQQRGGIRMPNDTIFFHLTRMTHMATSCVACGACTEACPTNIEIAKLFTVVGERSQKLFDYVAGRSLDDDLPLAIFKEEELQTFDR